MALDFAGRIKNKLQYLQRRELCLFLECSADCSLLQRFRIPTPYSVTKETTSCLTKRLRKETVTSLETELLAAAVDGRVPVDPGPSALPALDLACRERKRLEESDEYVLLLKLKSERREDL